MAKEIKNSERIKAIVPKNIEFFWLGLKGIKIDRDYDGFYSQKSDGTIRVNNGQFPDITQTYIEKAGSDNSGLTHTINARYYKLEQNLTLLIDNLSTANFTVTVDDKGKKTAIVDLSTYAAVPFSNKASIRIESGAENKLDNSNIKHLAERFGISNLKIDPYKFTITAEYKGRKINIKPHTVEELSRQQIINAFTAETVANSLLFPFEETAKEQS